MEDDDGSQTDAWPNVWHPEQEIQTLSTILKPQSRNCSSNQGSGEAVHLRVICNIHDYVRTSTFWLIFCCPITLRQKWASIFDRQKILRE